MGVAMVALGLAGANLMALAQSPPMRGVAHVAVRVADLERSRAFYQQLGFVQAFAAEKNGKPAESFLKINDRQFLELYPAADGKSTGFLHLCFEGSDLAALHDFYVSRGLQPTPVKTAGAGNLLFTMAGPEAQNIEYTQYMPGSKHTLDVGKHLGAERVATRMEGVDVGFEDVAAAREFYAGKLGFPPMGRDADHFRVPGDSGQQVDLEVLSPDNRAHILLHTDDLKRTARALRQRKIAFEKSRTGLSLRDPDGNLIELTAR